MKKFTQDVLGYGQSKSIKVPKTNIRSYAKYILREGSSEEKRELLGCLKSRLVLADGKISLKENH